MPPGPGGVYTPTYPGGWQNGPAGGTPISAAALNDMESGIEGALQAPTSPASGDLPIWDPTANGGKGGWNTTTNIKIAKAQLGSLGIVDADVAAGANIQASKLNGFPNDVTKALLGNGTWGVPSQFWVAGADVASAATVTITNPVHGVTGTTNIANISLTGAASGNQVALHIKGGPLTIQNNGGGTGNIRTLSGYDRQMLTNEWILLVYDGSHWLEVTAAPGLHLIWDSVAAGVALPAATITTPTIPQLFKHLIVEMSLLSDQAAAETAGFQVNSDNGSVYTYEVLEGQGASALASTATLTYAQLAVAEGTGTGYPAPSTAKIIDYTSARKRIMTSVGGYASGNLLAVRMVRYEPAAPAAISTLTFVLNGAGNFASGTRISIYGEV